MKSYVVYIDETKTSDNTQAFCAIAINEKNIAEYREKIESKRIDLLDDPLNDYPFTSKHNQKALKKSFHMTENHPDTRLEIWNILRYFSYEAFIYIYHDINDIQKIRNRYLKELYSFLQQRYKNAKINFIWEKDESQTFTYPTYIPIIEKIKKEEPLLCIPDHVLFVFWRGYYQDYTKKNEYQKISDKKYYEMFKDKLRYIKNDNVKKPYTHKNPLELWGNETKKNRFNIILEVILRVISRVKK